MNKIALNSIGVANLNNINENYNFDFNRKSQFCNTILFL